jgi:hypothetical protein
MGAEVTTADGIPVAGWVLRVDKDEFDVGPMVEAYGQIFRHPIPASDRAGLLAPGQPCFWFQADTSRVVGIWGVGEVVGEAFTAPVDPDDPAAGEHTIAEVEIYPLAKPIPLAKLSADPAFATSELVTDLKRANPIALRRGEVRAIEALEFEITPPSEEQLAALDELLDAEDG